VWVHSVVLLADAGHMATDAAGIGLSLLAVYWAGRPVTSERTFGYQRAELLAAAVNALVLLAIGGLVLVEAARRLTHAGHSEPALMLVFGVVAIIGNGSGLLLLRTGQGESLHVRGAYLEVLSDLLGAATNSSSGHSVAARPRTAARKLGMISGQWGCEADPPLIYL